MHFSLLTVHDLTALSRGRRGGGHWRHSHCCQGTRWDQAINIQLKDLVCLSKTCQHNVLNGEMSALATVFVFIKPLWDCSENSVMCDISQWHCNVTLSSSRILPKGDHLLTFSTNLWALAIVWGDTQPHGKCYKCYLKPAFPQFKHNLKVLGRI